MHLDFGLLSMTELRTRPGEILDRVADRGEAFIIEKNGNQKACLVPLSVFLPDVPPGRIADELKELNEHGESPRSSITDGRELAFQFTQSLDDDTSITVTILLPHGYPSNCPRVYVEPVVDGAPHRWKDGALCLYGVMSAWNPGKHTVYSTLELARKWLKNYAEWRKTGRWLAPEGEVK
jgi:prevent-host-death family protein